MSSDEIAGIVAASIPGIIAIVLAVVLWIRLRRVRGAQTVLLPDGSSGNLVDLHATLRRRCQAVDAGDPRSWSVRVDELAELRDARSARVSAGQRRGAVRRLRRHGRSAVLVDRAPRRRRDREA